MDEILNQAVANQDWVTLVIGAVLLVVPLVLKALGKNVPVLDPILEGLKSLLKMRAKKDVIPPLPKGEKEGLARVLEIEDAKDEDQLK